MVASLQDYPLAPLEDNCKLLGSLLDDCLRIEVGDELFEKVSLAWPLRDRISVAKSSVTHILLLFSNLLSNDVGCSCRWRSFALWRTVHRSWPSITMRSASEHILGRHVPPAVLPPSL